MPLLSSRISTNIHRHNFTITNVAKLTYVASSVIVQRPHSLNLAYPTTRPFSTNQPRNQTAMSPPEQNQIVIIGAGVLGLSTAIELQSRFRNRRKTPKITILAAEFPSLPGSWARSGTTTTTAAAEDDNDDNNNNNNNNNNDDNNNEDTFENDFGTTTTPSADYASMWAGAHYRPIPRSTRQLTEEFELATKTNEEMLRIARDYDENETGVAVVPAMELLERPPEENLGLRTGDVYAGVGDGFRVLSAEELGRVDAGNDGRGLGKVAWGCEYSSYCVNVHVYCRWLFKRFQEDGGKAIQTKVKGVEDVFEIIWRPEMEADDYSRGSDGVLPIVVNTSGRNFDLDPQMTIIRGQTVLVRNRYHRTITRQNSDGSWAFLIPRPGGGGTVVGGTKEIDDTETKARLETRRKLLENAVACFPDFVDSVDKFDVVMDNVGRRPWREGGLRLEIENFPVGDVTRTVVHGYGAGGRGYELSWGVADRIAELVEDQLEGSKIVSQDR